MNIIKKILSSVSLEKNRKKNFTPKDVYDAYHIILGREPENQNIVNFHLENCESLSTLLYSFWKSSEFQLKNGVQKQSQRTDSLTLHETKTGKYYLPTYAYADCIANTIISGYIYDNPVYEVAKQYIKPETIILDLGSNFGQMAILFSQLAKDNGIVHAFEADSFIFNILEKNIAANDCKNIQAHFGAVHDKSGEKLNFPVQDLKKHGTYGSFGIDYKNRYPETRQVNTLTIDEIKFDRPISFMKIDIQGGDLFALKGAVKTIKKHQMPIIFEYEYTFEDELDLNFQEYVDFVKSINYKFERVISGQNYLIVPSH
jgi:FkbM family methyltransferase